MRVLITGAAGTIGRHLRAGLRGRRELRLLDVAEQEPAGAGDEVVTASVADGAAMREAAEGMDAIVHLAANPVDAPFDVILEPNIVGTQRVFEASRACGSSPGPTARPTPATSARGRARATASSSCTAAWSSPSSASR